MNKWIKLCLIASAVIGAAVGAAALPYQHLVYGMEAPNWTWLIKVPVISFCFGAIISGVLAVCLGMLEGIIELLDPNEYWPHT